MNPAYQIPTSAPILTVSRATLMYRDGVVGGAYKVLQVRDVEVRTGDYAQYEAALFVSFTVKGARRRVSLVDTYAPSLVILDGWLEPSVPDAYQPVEDRGNGVTVKKTRALSCSSVWTTEARAAAVATGKVLADYHEHDTKERKAA